MTFPSFDTELLLYINHCNNVLLDGMMLKFSDTWTWSLMLLTVIFIVLRNRPWQEALLVFLGIGLCILLADQISSSLLKPWVARFRPTHDPEIMFQVRHIAGRMGQYGFVSSHAANTFAVGTFLALVFKHRITTICLMVWASVVGFSRIYLGVHFPGDILCGAIIGTTIGSMVYLLYASVRKRIEYSSVRVTNNYTRSGYLVDDVQVMTASIFVTFVFICI